MIVPIKSKYLQMSEEEFYLFCQDMDHFQIEREADGTILIMELTNSETGSFNANVTTKVNSWALAEKTGKTFDSSSGFTLPNDAVKSPDTAWIAIERWKALSKEERKRFAHISPDFVIEIRSKTDRLKRLQDKMIEYRDNGVRLGWLIDPETETVWIYRADGSIEKVPSFDQMLSGEDVLKGFELRLTDIWNGDEE